MPKTICGLDIGTSRLSACMYVQDKNKITPEVFFSSGNMRGFKKNGLTDSALFSKSVENVLSALSTKSGCPVSPLHLSIGGCGVYGKHSNATMALTERGSRGITALDIEQLSHQARIMGLNVERKVLYSTPLSYTVDDTLNCANPEGLYGHKVEVDLYLVTAPASTIENATLAVNNAGYEVTQAYLPLSAGSLSVLSRRQREEGVLLMDIGASLIEIGVFVNDRLKHFEVFDFGADELTAYLKEELGIGFEDAQEIKESYGSVLCDGMEVKEEVMINRGGKYLPMKRKEICALLVRRLEGLLKAMDGKLRYIISKEHLAHGIVAIGGGAYLDGLLEVMESRMGISVRMGSINPGSLEVKDIRSAGAAGVIQAVLEEEKKRFSVKKHFPGNVAGNILERMRQVYNDYF